jgi:hypothetical protein
VLEHASEDVVAERNELADLVCMELLRAGLPAYRGEGHRDFPGACVWVDQFVAEQTGGVFVDWESPLKQEAVDLIKQSHAAAIGTSGPGGMTEEQSRIAEHYGAVCKHMRKAIIGVLSAVQIEAVEKVEDMVIRVVSR